MLITAVGGAAMTALSGGGSGARFDAGSVACSTTGAPTRPVPGYSPEQIANAATIVAVGKRLQVPEHGQVVAIAAALQESGLRNLDHGDRDSLGVFQQRPSQGWGTPAQIMNPAYAATAFYRRLLDIRGWQQMSLNDAAQSVQRSATPTAYGRHAPAAQALTAAVSGATCAPPAAPGQVAAHAIAFAHAQIGLPTSGAATAPSRPNYRTAKPRSRAGSTAPASPRRPTPRRASTFPGPRRPSSTPAREFRPGNRWRPETWCSSAQARTRLPTWESRSPTQR